MTQDTEGLKTILARFQQQRAATLEPAALRENERQRAFLERTTDRGRLVKAGQAVPDFHLIDGDGKSVGRREILAEGPVLIVFFRFAGCPVCNIALPHYDRHLAPGLKARGVRLIGVSPQVPERLQEIRERHALSFPVATDPGNALARAFGIAFEPDTAARAFAESRGNFLPEVTGTGTWQLPMPAAILIDAEGVVRFADVTPDWLARTEPREILEAVDQHLADRLPA